MTPERIEELRDLFANYLTRSSDENKLLAFASEILDTAERYARLRAILRPLEALEAAATPGPWHHGPSSEQVRVGKNDVACRGFHVRCEGSGTHSEDAGFIAAARNALPALLREIQEVPDGRL